MRAKTLPDKVAYLTGIGFSNSEVAAMLNISPITVRTSAHRGRQQRQ